MKNSNLANQIKAVVLGWDESETDYSPSETGLENCFHWENHLPVQLAERELNDEDMN